MHTSDILRALDEHLLQHARLGQDLVLHYGQEAKLRQLRFCSGHALLVGVGGSGKQSLARLSGFICGYATYTIVISGNYNIKNFRKDLQKMYKRAGVKVGTPPFKRLAVAICCEHAGTAVCHSPMPCQLKIPHAA